MTASPLHEPLIASLPPNVMFGWQTHLRAGEIASRLGATALLVSGMGSLRRTGAVERVKESLTRAGLTVAEFAGVPPDPDAAFVDAGARHLTRRACDVLVAVGGGSVIDAAKVMAVSAAVGSCGPLVGQTLANPNLGHPVLAIPSTAGTGSEVTAGAIIQDRARRLKAGIRGPALVPRAAIVDPSLTASAPYRVSVATGFDALAHAIEGFCGRRATAKTRARSAAGVALVARHLPEIAADPLDVDARTGMALAAVLGGLNVVEAGTCLPHRLQQSLGATEALKLSHGEGLAYLYHPWLKTGAATLFPLIKDLGIQAGLRDMIYWLVQQVEATRIVSADVPKQLQADDVEQCFDSITGDLMNDPSYTGNRAGLRSMLENAFA